MLEHHIQRKIVYRLALTPSLKFSELKPDTIENKLFTYHLKKVVAAGLVEKNEDGHYALTPQGRLLGVHVLERTEAMVDRAYSVLFLVIRRKSDGAWLLYKRGSHPLYGRVGFMHATPNAHESSIQTAARVCKEHTGIDAHFSALGSGFFRVFERDELESFTNFTLLVCEDASGELDSDDELAEYFWADSIDQERPTLLPNMPTLIELYETGKPFFTEKALTV
jgi:ADP-ribose pyrophosphatase YjhB (NUDIX family)